MDFDAEKPFLEKTTLDLYNEARAARHAILAGASLRSIKSRNGDSLDYNRANIGLLEIYISELKAELDGVGIDHAPLTFDYGA